MCLENAIVELDSICIYRLAEGRTKRMQQQPPNDVIVDATIVGTSYRKILCYATSEIINLKLLKARVVDDLTTSGAPLENASEVVLRNYVLNDYESLPFNSSAARSCVLSDEDSWSSCHVKSCRLLAAEPCPQVPIGPADDDSLALLAISSRQLYDRSCGGGTVLPLEARVKPLATEATGTSEAANITVSVPTLTEGSEAVAEIAATSTFTKQRRMDLEPFDITVRDFRGRCHSGRVCGDMLVARLKLGIAAALGCSIVSHWRLMYEGRPLDDNLQLSDYSIPPGALVDVKLSSQQHKQQPAQWKAGGGALGVGVAAKDGAGGGAAIGTKVVPPNCSAPWANPIARGVVVTQISVQVLLPCGNVVHVIRYAAEDGPQFVCRVLEAGKALLAPPEATAEAPVQGSQAALPEVVEAAPSRSPLLPVKGRLPKLGLAGAAYSSEKWQQRHQLKEGLHSQKLLAVLLAAAAVVMAIAVL